MSSKDVLEKLYKFFQTEKKSEERTEQRRALHHLKEELEKNGVKKEEFEHELNILYSKEEKKEKLTSEEISTLRKETLSEEEIKTLKNDLLTKCPYAKFDHFKESDWKFYAQLLSCAKLMYAFEQNGIPEDHAYKLSMIFSDLRGAIEYLKKYPSMHDACLFSMPINDVTWEVWKKLAQKYLFLDTEFGTTILPQASKLEEFIKKNPEKLESPQREALLKEIIIGKEGLEKLSRSLGIPENKDQYDKRSKEILEKQIELVKGGLQFSENLKLEELKAVRSCFLEKYSASYKYFFDKGLTEKDYQKFSTLNRENAGKNIPEIKIDGKNLKPPHSDFYLRKLDVSGNENDAAMAACLGKVTDCCQYLGGVGDSCVRHGLTNENGGFYVVCHKNHENQEVVEGQCWVWRSKDKALVFDSIEVSNKGDNKEIVKSFFDAAAKELVKKDTHKVVCGSHSGISKKMGVKSVMNRREELRDYSGYTDATSQRVIMDKDKPFYLYGLDNDYTKKTEEMIEEALSDKERPLMTSSLMMILNWAVLNQKKNLIEKINEIASRNCPDRLREIQGMQDYLDRFLKLTDKESFRSLIRSIKDYNHINVVNAQGKGLLSLAISIDPESALHLLDKKKLNKEKWFDLDVADNKGNTALMLAASKGHIKIVEALIENDANVDLNNNDGNTALMLAASKGYIRIMEALIQRVKKGAINLKDNNGNTALMLAVSNRNISGVYALIENHANIGLQNNDSNTALMLAVFEGDIKIVEALIQRIEKGAINLKDNTGNTALMLAVLERNKKIVEALIKNRANIDLQDNEGNTALMKAVYQRPANLELITYLIKCGADVTLQNKEGDTALMQAVSDVHDNQILKLFIDIGIKKNGEKYLNLKDNEGNTVLMKAISQRPANLELITYLIEHGADVTLQDNKGDTALMKAVSKGHKEIVEALIKKGAYLCAKKEERIQLLKLASKKEIKEMLNQAEKIESHDPHKGRPLLFDGGPGTGKGFSTQEKYKKTEGLADNLKASDDTSVHQISKHI